MKKSYALFILSILILLVAGCGSDNGTGGDDEEEEFVQANLLVYNTATEPSMENINDPIWDSAATCSVRIGFDTLYGVNSSMSDDTVLMKVIKTSTDIYVRATWLDYSSDYMGNYIRKSAGSGTWELVNIEAAGAGEDAFFIFFDVGNNGTEMADCATMCHAIANDMATTGGGNVDSWAWRSGTTNPAKLAQDQWVASATGLDGDVLVSGNRLAYFDNWQSFPPQPKFTHVDDTLFTGNYLFTSDTAAYVYEPPYIWDSVVGYRMPANYIDSTVYKDPDAGGQWDVKAISGYASNSWTIVLKRSLTTDRSSGAGQNDVPLSGLDSIQVTVAASNHHTDVEEDPTWREHSGSHPFYLVFNRPAD